jgi:MtrB/PioB family decaheme-associated outer membrane protein
MNTSKQYLGLSQTLIALAVLAAFGPARGQETGDIAQLTAPGSSVSVGLGTASGDSGDRARFGMFNGLRDNKYNGLFGFSYLDRDNESGRWITFEGRNLGLDNRELGFSYRKLGDWKFAADYSEITRHDPRTINTGLQGAGTTTPTVNLLASPGTGQDLNLELKRKGVTLGGETWLSGTLQFEATFKNEDKNGARFFGRGFACASAAAPGCLGPTATATGWALLMLPEPINSTIRQLDAKLNYSGDKLKLTGGYYGSFYINDNGNLTPTVPDTLNNAMGTPLPLSTGLQSILQQPMALPPDSQAHQIYVSGNYRFTPATRATFKYAYTHATQDEDFAKMGLTGAPAGRSSLGGVVDTTLGQLGLTTRPMDKLSLLTNVRYESKDNKTPIDLYNTEGTNTFTNGNPSPRKLNAKLEGSYQLPANNRATLGVDYEAVDHGTWTATDSAGGVTGLKQKTAETGWRAELRRSMSETLTGALSYVSSRREGKSSWLRPNTVANAGTIQGVTPVSDAAIFNRTAIFPFIYEDRERDKVKLMTNWTPTERLSLQFLLENGKDTYHGPTEHGLRDSGYRFYSADASYTLSEAWTLTGYLSRGDQIVHAGHSTGYDAALRDITDSIGLRLVGKPSGRLQVGGDLTYLHDRLIYQQDYDPLASATNKLFLTEQGGLPDVTYRLLRLKLFGEYAVQKNAYIRLDFVHERTYFNEWTYGYNGVPFTYSDNTTLGAKQNQSVNFIGASLIFRWL